MTQLSDLSDHPFFVLLVAYVFGSLVALAVLCVRPAVFRGIAEDFACVTGIDGPSTMAAVIVGWMLGWPLALTAQLLAWLHGRSRGGAV